MNLGKIRLLFLAAGLFVAPLLLFSTKLTPWGASNQFATVIGEVSYPFSWAWHKTINFFGDSWSKYSALLDAANENLKLKSEIDLLRIKFKDYEERNTELVRLREVMGFAASLEDNFVIAEVITGTKSSPFKTIRISKGTNHGLSAGMPVITSNGVVGRVIRSGLFSSDVHLLVDYDSNVDILIQRSRVRGVLNGFANEECRLALQRSAEVRIGDTIVTSGIVGSFPKGLPVGKIVKISFETDNVTQVITVQPWVDYRSLDEVIVLLRKDPQLESITETAGQDWLEKSTKYDQSLTSGE